MPGLTESDDVLLPLEERAGFVSITDEKAERRLPAPANKTTVNIKHPDVPGIVSSG